MRPSLRLFVAILLLSMAPAVRGQSAAGGTVDEYRVKAAVLYNLARFVSWPPGAFTEASSPLLICVLGVDPFGARLDDIALGHRVGERRVATARIADVRPDCHVLFISDSEQRRLPALLSQLRGSRTLTVAESPGFITLGGMVALTTKGDQVGLDVNLQAAEAEQLRVSARLLALSSSHRRAADGKP